MRLTLEEQGVAIENLVENQDILGVLGLLSLYCSVYAERGERNCELSACKIVLDDAFVKLRAISNKHRNILNHAYNYEVRHDLC